MASSLFTVNLNHIAANWRMFVSKCEHHGDGGVEVGAVLKADAYGLGAKKVAACLYSAGCRRFFVADGSEGGCIRDELRALFGAASEDVTIIVFHGCQGGQEAYFADKTLIPVLNSRTDLERWVRFANETGYNDAVLHVDTGMNRLGFPPEAFKALLLDEACLKALNVRMIMTHLTSADDPDALMNLQQKQRFDEVISDLPPSMRQVPLSMANSAGALMGADFSYDLVRVGIGLYGGNPFSSQDNPCRAAVTLTSEVLQVRPVSKDETVSYGATWKAKTDCEIATIAIGYADGLMRSLGDAGRVFIKGAFAPIVGRVTMDMIMVDVTGLDVEQGDLVEIFGEAISVDDVAAQAGTISYEILTNFGHRCGSERIERVYISE